MRPVLDRFILRRKETTTGAWTPQNAFSHRDAYSLRPTRLPATDELPLTESSFWVRNSHESKEDRKEGGVKVKRDWDVHYL